MGGNTEISRICPLLSITGRETVCQEVKCAWYLNNAEEEYGHCFLISLALSVAKMCALAEKYE